MGSLWPMIPVENTSTCSALQFMPAAVNFAIFSASAKPCSPVQALALPALIMSARATPLLFFKCWRQTVTGAAQTRFFVKHPAAEASSSQTTSAKSGGSSLAVFNPQCSEAVRNPGTLWMRPSHGPEEFDALLLVAAMITLGTAHLSFLICHLSSVI